VRDVSTNIPPLRGLGVINGGFLQRCRAAGALESPLDELLRINHATTSSDTHGKFQRQRRDIFVEQDLKKNLSPVGAAYRNANLEIQGLTEMANTYTQIYVHIVFAVEGRQNLIRPERNDELQKYITGIVQGQRHKLIVINNMPDHVHLFVGLRPDASLSDLVRDIKAASSKFINEQRWVVGRFGWQEGFGAFSYARSQLNTVIQYIQNQQQHHAGKTFRQEYVEMLEKFGVTYDQRYIFKSDAG
jgi:putative transposase